MSRTVVPPASSRRLEPRRLPARPPAYVLVVGHAERGAARASISGASAASANLDPWAIEREDGTASLLRQLGAEVRTRGLWDESDESDESDMSSEVDDSDASDEASRSGSGPVHPLRRPVRAVVVEVGERPDIALGALRHLRRHVALDRAPVIVATSHRQIARLDPSSGFDDFIVLPCPAEELYARIRALEWRRSEFANEERSKVGGLLVDRVAHEVSVDGRSVALTAKEFALVSFLAANRGRVFSRDSLLARVWGRGYSGGPRTVDIHVRRLRAKIGDSLPLETIRGAGYKMRAPEAGE